MYVVVGPNGWSFDVSHGMPRISDNLSMSVKLYEKVALCLQRGEMCDKSCMGAEQSSLNSSVLPSAVAWPSNHMRPPFRCGPPVNICWCHPLRALL